MYSLKDNSFLFRQHLLSPLLSKHCSFIVLKTLCYYTTKCKSLIHFTAWLS